MASNTPWRRADESMEEKVKRLRATRAPRSPLPPAPRKHPRLPYTQIPNFCFDEYMPTMTAYEWKVYSYVLRRTYGWQRTSDPISLDQFVNGLEVKGKHVDGGTGLSEAQIKRVLKTLEAGGYIRRVRRGQGAGQRSQPTVIELVMEDAHP